MDQLSAMRAFIRVVESGSFTRAAITLSASKANVSKKIHDLEDHLKVKLIDRTTRHVTITTAGSLYYKGARRIISNLEEAEETLSSSQISASGRLRVEMVGALVASIVAPALANFYEQYPGITIDLCISDGAVDYVAENVDCALRVGRPTDLALIARRLGQLEMATCAAPDYIQRFGKPEHPHDLERGHQSVGYFRSHSYRVVPLEFLEGDRRIELKPNNLLSVNDARTLVDALKAGLGVGQIPLLIAQDAIAAGQLVPLLQGWPREALSLYVVYPPNQHLSKKVRVFVDWLISLLATLR